MQSFIGAFIALAGVVLFWLGLRLQMDDENPRQKNWLIAILAGVLIAAFGVYLLTD